MKIKDTHSKNKEIPTIVSNVSGRIVYMNSSAKKGLGSIKIGDSIEKLVDLDRIQKLSMSNEAVDIVEVKRKNYKEAYVKVNSSPAGRTIELRFYKGYEKNEKEILTEKQMFATINNINVIKNKCNIDIQRLVKDIKDAINTIDSNNRPFVNCYADKIVFCHYDSHLLALILCGIMLAHEISPKRPIDLYIKKKNDKLEIKVIVRVDETKSALSFEDVEDLYPFTSLRMEFISSLCERNDIENSISVINKAFSIRLLADELPRTSKTVRTVPFYKDELEELIKCLQPRENIKEKYAELSRDIIEEEQE